MMRRFLLVGWLALALSAAAGASRIVAVGDVHGEIDGFITVLQAAGLVDDRGAWAGGDAILVQTGDITDRGSRVRAVMDRMRALESQAAAAGGRVVALLGNHEVSNLAHLFDEQSTPAEVYHRIWADFAGEESERKQRDAYKSWRRWQRRYPACGVADRKAWLAAHPPGFVEYVEALSPEGEYGRWLRGLPVVAKVDDTIFLHGGLSSEIVEQGYRSLDEINRVAHEVLRQLDDDRRQLIADEIIVPFSTLQEMHCAMVWEIGALETADRPEKVARRDELTALRQRLPAMPGWLLTDEAGPVWFRGLATWDETEKDGEVDRILETFGGRRIVVGHTPGMGEIRSRFGGRVYLIDTAMAYAELGGRAAALELDGDRVVAIYADGRQLLDGPPAELPAASGAGGLAEMLAAPYGPAAQSAATTAEEAASADTASEQPSGRQSWIGADGTPLPFASSEELLEFLSKAKVVDTYRIRTGVTLPRKLLLEKDGARAHAIFHDVAIETRRERLVGGIVVNFFRDHYENNVAAYELSRLLEMPNVPPAVLRKISRRSGSVQIWIENAKTEAARRQERTVPTGDWRLAFADMWVFDNLINNIDRNQGNILFDSDWNVWLIDHTRAFSRTKQLPDPARIKRCSRRLWRALRELGEDEMRERLGPYLSIYEIRAIDARRELLIALIEEKIREKGEDEVLFSYGEPAAAAGDEDEAAIPEAPADS